MDVDNYPTDVPSSRGTERPESGGRVGNTVRQLSLEGVPSRATTESTDLGRPSPLSTMTIRASTAVPQDTYTPSTYHANTLNPTLRGGMGGDPTAVVNQYMCPHDVYTSLCRRLGCKPNAALLRQLRNHHTCCDTEECDFEPLVGINSSPPHKLAVPSSSYKDAHQLQNGGVVRDLFIEEDMPPASEKDEILSPCCGLRPTNRALDFSTNYLGVVGLRPVLGLLRHVRSFSSIDLTANQLNHKAVVELVASLDGAEHITSLNLSSNTQLTSASGRLLSVFVANNPNILVLELLNTGIPPGQVRSIQALLATNRSLSKEDREVRLLARRRNFSDSALQCYQPAKRRESAGVEAASHCVAVPPVHPVSTDELMFLWQSAGIGADLVDGPVEHRSKPTSQSSSPPSLGSSISAEYDKPICTGDRMPIAASQGGAYPGLAMLHDVAMAM